MRKEEIKLIGLKLGHKTTNKNGQSGIDCGGLWQDFQTKNVPDLLQGKTSLDVYAVYYDYEGDHTAPFSYFIGCPMPSDSPVPKGLDEIVIPQQNYQLVVAKGKMPDCIVNAWNGIWNSNLQRSYGYDFEVYGKNSQNWDDAEIELFISVKV